MAIPVEGSQKAGLQPGNPQGFVKSLVPIRPLLLTQNVLTALSLITYVMFLLMRIFSKISEIWIFHKVQVPFPPSFTNSRRSDALSITEGVLS